MLNSPALNHAKVLLHLKWFINRLAKSFEHKLQTSGTLGLHPSSERHISNSPLASQSNLRSLNSPGRSPIAAKSLAGNLKNRSLSTDGDRLSLSGKTPDFECGVHRRSKMLPRLVNQNRSPKVRSLTNSPFMMRISLTRILSGKRIPLSECSESNSDLGEGSQSEFPQLHFPDFSDESLSGLDVKDLPFSPFHDIEQFRILLILRSTTESERRISISRFAQHLCVVYEYQIGFLQGLKAVHSAADYVADVLIRSIRTGRISSLSPNELTLQLLYDTSCKPSSQTKCIKTSPMTGTGEQLSWRLGEIWTRPGLRHNEVGGENCHNLNIVTHFLAPCSAELEIKRPDIYGYRNLIVLPNAEPSTFFPDGVYENTNLNDATIFANGNSEIGVRPVFYDIFLPDEETIAVSNIRTGSRVRSPLSKVQKIEQSPSSLVQRRDVAKRQQSIKSKSPLLSTSVNLRQHLHRAYRPVFFVIYERPSVIDHLTECESFAAFCKRQNICPVMFLNQETDLFEGRTCANLFQNFDIFCLTTNGYLSKTLSDGPSDRSTTQKSTREENRLRRTADVCLGGIDNPGFVS
ncbi:unnamed protein product [Hydatigera taeniaeformis]|uniref:ERCC4 domain-containing protein n=1 Tax=Hydatigena taeniaeformis TaxID=6205 RepID=A0A0R3X598_HYDTA|nr:unnamed protein product [Hydatigera taeniaeformis]